MIQPFTVHCVLCTVFIGFYVLLLFSLFLLLNTHLLLLLKCPLNI